MKRRNGEVRKKKHGGGRKGPTINGKNIRINITRRSREKGRKERGGREGEMRDGGKWNNRCHFYISTWYTGWKQWPRWTLWSFLSWQMQAQMAGLPPPLLPAWGPDMTEEHRERLTQILARWHCSFVQKFLSLKMVKLANMYSIRTSKLENCV